MKIKPLRDNVLIKAKPADRKTKSGVFLVEKWKTLPLEGKVIDTGPDVRLVKKGDNVLFMRYASLILEDDERLATEKHILAVYND